MIFNEIYGAYYNTVARIISEALIKAPTKSQVIKIIEENAFSESCVEILDAIKNERWNILKSDFTTNIKNQPTMPLTHLQKMWLKSILMDKRIKLFIETPWSFLGEVEPLFLPQDYFVFDRYSNGDNFEDKEYVSIFRAILNAIKEKRAVKLSVSSRSGNKLFLRAYPTRIEYSQKDDKMRAYLKGCKYASLINLSNILECKLCNDFEYLEEDQFIYDKDKLVIKIVDERNALERVMLHFAHFKKTASKNDDGTYRLEVEYNVNDEREMVMRLMSFGQLIRVESPERVITLIKNKLISQRKLFEKGQI